MRGLKKSGELKGHAGAVYCLDQGRYAHTVLSGAADGFIAEWNLQTLQPEKFSVKFDSPVFAMCHIVHHHLLVAGLFNGHIHVIDTATKQEIKHISVPSKGVFAFCFDEANGKLYSGGGDGVLNVWDVTRWELMLSLPLCEGKIREIKLDYSKGLLYVCCGDGMLRILETSFYNEVSRFFTHQGGINSLCLTQHELYTAGKDAHIGIYDSVTHALLQRVPAHNYGIYRIKKWHELAYVTCSRDKTIKIWEPGNWQDPQRLDYAQFRGHTHSVNDLHVSLHRPCLVSCSDDKKLMVWDRA